MRILFTCLAIFCFSSAASATDWLTLPSTYTHHPVTGQRVSQYQQVELPTAPSATNFRTSGFTHTRSSLNYGASSDNYHRTEKWGEPVRPYGEWRFPFRPYSTPYPNWGAPYAGLNIGAGFPGYGGGSRFHPGQGYPQQGFTGQTPPGQTPHRHDGLFERGYLGDGVWPSDRSKFRGNVAPANPLNPYPAGPGTPYPVAPYYDGDYRAY